MQKINLKKLVNQMENLFGLSKSEAFEVAGKLTTAYILLLNEQRNLNDMEAGNE